MENKDLYFVALKVFLEDGKGNFLITKDKFGDWDIPGGRLRENDFNAPFPEVIARKMKEELGEGVKYELGEPVVFMRHQRDEVLPSGQKEPRRIFAIGYRAKHLGGEIKLGYNHEQLEWVSLKDFKPEDYFNGGWLEGVKEYQKIIKAKNPPK
ncbi:MAG: NUDIX domain-containing protein [Candidatus Buchananbacteria bacterium]|nr:NUDIX domain-containing protein [Candidatus Buchananbacteria bacterium]